MMPWWGWLALGLVVGGVAVYAGVGMYITRGWM